MTSVAAVEPKARHGRQGTRLLRALTDPAPNASGGEAGTHRTPWPHARRVCWERRVRCRAGAGEDEVGSAVTGLPPERAGAARLLAALRGHRGIENRVHWVRGVTYDEDRCPIRGGAAPQVCAALRKLAIALPRGAGVANIAAACRTCEGRPASTTSLLAAAGHQVMK